VQGTGINNTGVIRNTGATAGSYAGSITMSTNSTFGVTGAGSLTLSGTVSDGGTGSTLTVMGTNTSGPLVLGNSSHDNNSFGGIGAPIRHGAGHQPNALGGSGLVTVGDSAGCALNATLLLGGSSSFTLNNPISVQAGNTGVMTLGGINPAGTTVTYGNSVYANQAVTVDSTNAGAITAFVSGFSDGSNQVALTKGPGAGTVQIQGANSYSGATVINGGVLQFESGSGGSGTVTVNATGTLAGFGGNNVSIAGNIVVNSGGAIAPGGIGNTVGSTTLSLGATSLSTAVARWISIFAPGGSGPALENIVFNSGSGTFTIKRQPQPRPYQWAKPGGGLYA